MHVSGKLQRAAPRFLAVVALGFLLAIGLPAGQETYPGSNGSPRTRVSGSNTGSHPGFQKTLLIWADTRNGIAQHDSVSHAMAVIERLGYESGAYFAYIRTDSNIISYHPKMTDGKPASGGPSLGKVDAIFFLGHREIDLDQEQRADLLRFVHDEGKGFVAAHTALTAFDSWPEFKELLGGRFDGHPWGNTEAQIINEEPTFPAVCHLPRVFTLKDEFYQPKEFSRQQIDVLLRLDTSHLDMSRPSVHLKDGDVPLAWAKMYGKGRVFYSSLGHDAKTWDNPDIQKMYFEAIKWALRLTDANPDPHPMRNP